jgi:NAD+ kinase
MTRRFSRIGLIGRYHDPRVVESATVFARHLLDRGLEVLVEDHAAAAGLPQGIKPLPVEELAARADLVVAIGGDGTMLYAAQLVIGRALPLLGINRGRLGFLADVSPPDMTSSFDAILDGQYQEDVRALLSARLERPGMEPLSCHALNDVVIQKFETGRMVEFETWIGGVFVNTHGGDGLVVATSTGSTAYALSCGGPIIHPRLDALVLAPISPHTLSDRPIVVGRDSEIELRLARRSPTRAQVTFDGAVLGDLDHGGRLTVGAARQSVTLLHPPGHDFFRILRSKLHWGRSARHPDEGDPPC